MRLSDDLDHEVVVVGAGIAGLSCAAVLAANGVDVVVLEARERTGGRLLSIPSAHLGGAPALDLGATWFWPDQSAVQDLIARLEVGVFAQNTRGDGLLEPPAPRGAPAIQRLRGNLEPLAYRFTHGAQSLTDALTALLPAGTIRLSSPVTAISTELDGLRVDAGTETLRADQVIIAVPPALAVATMTFTPGLSETLIHLARSTPVWMADTTKVIACYDRPFWRDAGLAGAVRSFPGPLREVHDMSGPAGFPAALFGFVIGASVPTRLHLRELVRQQLARLFGSQAAEPIELHVQDWSAEQYTNPPRADVRTDHRYFGDALYRTPALSDRVHWASTETATAHAGHIEGALHAAARASTTVLGRRIRDVARAE